MKNNYNLMKWMLKYFIKSKNSLGADEMKYLNIDGLS